jgi:hypothetical protein
MTDLLARAAEEQAFHGNNENDSGRGSDSES